jgi:hypothetical protein
VTVGGGKRTGNSLAASQLSPAQLSIMNKGELNACGLILRVTEPVQRDDSDSSH